MSGVNVPEGYMRDAQDRLIPVEQVKEIDRTRDEVVREIYQIAQSTSEILRARKKKMVETFEAFIDLSAEKYEVKFGGKKGNITLISYDGEYKIIRAVSDYRIFDERLQFAKQLIDECVTEWSKDSNPKIKSLINDAFQVDKQGRINTDRILGLRKIDIDDPQWLKAMDAIVESLQVIGSKQYLRIYKKKEDGSYEQVPLDLAAI